jgi:hypothetical protein
MIAILVKTFLISSIIFLSILFLMKRNVFNDNRKIKEYVSVLGIVAMFAAYVSLLLTIVLWY